VFPGCKGGRCLRLTTLPPYCAVVTKSENRNFLGPSGSLQACNGTVLPLVDNVAFNMYGSSSVERSKPLTDENRRNVYKDLPLVGLGFALITNEQTNRFVKPWIFQIS